MKFYKPIISFYFFNFTLSFCVNAQKNGIDSLLTNVFSVESFYKIKQESCFGFMISKDIVSVLYSDEILLGEKIRNELELSKKDVDIKENILFLTICGDYATFKKRKIISIRNEFNTIIYDKNLGGPIWFKHIDISPPQR